MEMHVILTQIGPQNNVVCVYGTIASNILYSHQTHGNNFYRFALEVPRLSTAIDKILITITENMLLDYNLKPHQLINVEGQFRSYNNNSQQDLANKLLLTVFAKKIQFVQDCSISQNSNHIYLNGYICKQPLLRGTPLGKEIADILLAVNREHNKSDYIPCIAWGKNARLCSNLKVGTNIEIEGRIQSRTYQKKLSPTQSIARIAYEVSIFTLNCKY